MTPVAISSSELRRLAVVALTLAGTLEAAADEPPIEVSVAPLYVGQVVTLEGEVTRTHRDGYVVRLQLGEEPQTVMVQLQIGMLSRFPPHPEAHYLGKEIRVVGRVDEFRGQIEMRIRDPDHIALVDELQSDTADEEVRALQDRVRRLEQRLEDLEADPLPTP